MTADDLFGASASRNEVSDTEWAGGWSAITEKTNGIPTAQQFDYVLYMLSYFIKANKTKLAETTKKSEDAVPNSDYTSDNILKKLLTVDGAGSGLDADLLDGHEGAWYAPLTRAWTVYTDTVSGTTHKFVGIDSEFGIVRLSSAFESGQTITVNGTTVSVSAGGDTCDGLPSGHYYAFHYDAANKMLDFLSAGMSKYLQKTGGTMTGSLFFGDTSKYITSAGAAVLASMQCSGDIRGSKVYGAVYNNDYAEFFPRGEETEVGDIIALSPHSEKEEYVKATSGMRIVGVHSGEYANVIGGENPPDGENFIQWNERRFIPVGMAGRCVCKVCGPVTRGQYIVASEMPGIGKAVNDVNTLPDVVGFAVEDCGKEGVNLVKVKLGR